MARPMKPFVKSGGYYPSNRWTPLVYPGGYTTANGGEEPAPPPIEKTVTGNPIHILDALAKPAQALSVKIEPVQDLHGYDNPWPAGGGVNLLPSGGALDATRNGIRFVSDGKGTYIIRGTATADAGYDFPITEINIPSTVYLHMLNNVSTYNIAFAFFNGNTQISAPTPVPVNAIKDVSVQLGGKTVNRLRLFVANGYTANITFSPMLCIDNTVKPFAPYSNICPISGHTDADVIVSPTLNKSDGTTYPIPLGQTVYGGTLDVTTGKLTVDRAMVDLGAKKWYLSTAAGRTRFWASITDIERISSPNIVAPMLCSAYKTETANNTYTGKQGISLQQNVAVVYIYDPQTESMTTAEFKSAMSGVQLVYKLATPITYDLTPTEVTLLLGENNIWSDGEMTLTYLADGNASDEEALNILLGGRYTPSDDVTDKEALDIILGGTE